MPKVLRETEWFVATPAKKGVRITAKSPTVTPRSRVVSMATWERLERMSDDSFNGSVIMDLGVGAFSRKLGQTDAETLPPARRPAQTFDVYIGRKLIDTVFYGASDKVTTDEVRRALIEHDGYDPAIRVVKRRRPK